MRHCRALAALLALVGLVLAGQAHVSSPRRANGGTYTVRRGDTLTAVARKTGVPVRALARANGLANPHRVRAGQVLQVPRSSAKAQAPLSSAVYVATGNRIHRVQRGETLASIAMRYGTTVSTLRRANGIGRGGLRAGRTLQVPGPPWLCPVRGRVDFADSWGAPRPGGRRHAGTDLFAKRGTPVVANVNGSLRQSRGSLAGLGYSLAGDDGHSYYGAHLHSLAARSGRISRGQLIGTVGSTGNARGTTPHLHFELKQWGRRAVNPYHTLRRWCRNGGR